MQPPPLVDPDQPLLGGFTIRLPFPMARRVDNGSLVFWHTPKGLTFWIGAGTRNDRSIEPLAAWRQQRSEAATDELVEQEGDLVRFGYRLAEAADDDREPAFYGFVAQQEWEFTIAAYFDEAEAIDAVLATWRSIRFAG